MTVRPGTTLLRRSLCVLLGLLALGGLVTVHAGSFEYNASPPSGQQSFATKYPTYYGTYGCGSCHTSAPILQVYGTAYKNAATALGGRSQANVNQALINIEQLDSDGDGYKNITEINTLYKAYDATHHPTASVALSTGDNANSGAPGSTVPYSVTVTNNGNITDSFTLGVSTSSGQSWTPSIVGTANNVAAGGTANITVNVAISGGATNGQTSVSTVTAVSQAKASVSATPLNLTTTATVAAAVARYVNAATGSNVSNNCANAGSPCKTLTYAMSQAQPGNPGDTINVAPGTYNLALGEVFPIAMKSGVQLRSTGTAENTIIDAAGDTVKEGILALESNNSSSASITGFTFRNGINLPGQGGSALGGAIYVSGGTGTLAITRNIFTANESRGYSSDNSLGHTGGISWGGAIAVFSHTVSITNNVFTSNIARGGNGFSHPGTPLSGNENGGEAIGGAIYFSGSGSVTNNTFYGNNAIGGNGGTASNGTGNGGGAQGGAIFAPAPNIVNNIFVSNGAIAGTGGTPETVTAGAIVAPSAPSNTNNLFFVNYTTGTVSGSDDYGSNALHANPLFHGAPTNLRIGLSSPAKGTGTASGAPSVDFDGVTRPNPPSRGAYEASGSDMPSTDFNADMKSDILWRNFSTGGIFRMLMNGFSITSGALVYTEPNTAWKVVGDADFNGDGVSDLLWRNTTTGQVYLMTFNASGFTSGGGIVYTEPNAAWKIVHTPDLNGDGKADILWWNSSTGMVYAMLMSGLSITNQGVVYQEPNTSWQIAGVGDFSGSGKQNQLLWRNISTGQVYMMTVTNTGNTFSQSGVGIYTSQLLYKIVGIADFNGDGRSDVLWRHDTTGAVYIFLMNGSSITFEGQIYQEPNTNWRIVAVGDYNGNGKADILWRNYQTGQVFMMLMNGASIASASMVYQEPNVNWRVLGPYEYSQ